MKKKFEKKLVLNKKTIAHLGNEEMNLIYGGSFLILTCGCSESCSLVWYCCGTEPRAEGEPFSIDCD